MSNLHKAERVIAKHLGSSDPYSITSGQAAESLEAAGLLAPDLPEPYPYSGASPCWYEGSFRAGISSTFGGHEPKVTFTDLEPGGVVHMDSESARELALMLLAAANFAGKEQGNE